MGKLVFSPLEGVPAVLNGVIPLMLCRTAPWTRGVWVGFCCGMYWGGENGTEAAGCADPAVPSSSSTGTLTPPSLAEASAPAMMWSLTQVLSTSLSGKLAAEEPSQNERVPEPGCGTYRSITVSPAGAVWPGSCGQ